MVLWGDLFFVGQQGGSGLVVLKAYHFLELSKGKCDDLLIYMLDLGHATFIDDVAMYC